MNLRTIIVLVEKATCPEDVFGKLNGEPLGIVFKRMAKLVHPDKHSGKNKAAAEEAFKKLNDWYEQAEAKVEKGIYGDFTTSIIINTKANSYTLGAKIASGDMADIYSGKTKSGEEVAVKIVRSRANNDLMANEAKILRHVRSVAELEANKAHIPASKLYRHIPTLLDSFELRDGKINKRVNVRTAYRDCYTLAQVRNSFPDGAPLHHAAWMFNRLLGVVIAAVTADIVNAAIVPEHVLVFPADHNGVLTDWCYAVRQNEVVKAIVPSRKDFYPKEILEKKPVGFGADVFMAAKCMIFLLGGDTKTNNLPKETPRALKGLLRSCLLSAKLRTDDALEVFDEFAEILKAIYGPPKFRPFVMPNLASK